MVLKRRVTEEQKTGEIGEGQVATRFTELGWNSHKVSPDYGEDLIINIADDGVPAGLGFWAQVKSTEDISAFQLKSGNRDYSYPVEVKDLNHWRDHRPPVVLILWDIKRLVGYWVMVDDAIKALSEKGAEWQEKVLTEKGGEPRVKVRFPSSNILDESTLIALRHKVASISLSDFQKGKDMKMELDFSFPSDDEGSKAKESVQRYIDFGEEVTISGKHIQAIRVPDWHRRKFGQTLIKPDSSVKLGPIRSDRADQLRITILNKQGRELRRQVIEAKATSIGEKRIILSNEHSPTPFFFKFVSIRGDKHSLHISLKGAKASARDTIAGYEFFHELKQGHIIRIEMLSRPELLRNNKIFEQAYNTNLDYSFNENWMKFLETMRFIEDKLGVSFQLTDTPIDESDWSWVYRIAHIISTGRVEHKFKFREVNLENDSPHNDKILIFTLLEYFEMSKPIKLNAHVQECNIELLGATLSLGPCRYCEEGQLSKKSAQHLRKLLKKDDITKAEYVLENGELIEEYTQWLVDPPKLIPLEELVKGS
jgi:hypothetical protein